jgi:hypothetical protein
MEEWLAVKRSAELDVEPWQLIRHVKLCNSASQLKSG